MADSAPPPPPGTIAYAEWKSKEEIKKQDQAQKPGNQETGNLGRKEVGKETSQEVRKETSQEVGQLPWKEAAPSEEGSLVETPLFKASFLFTEEEMELFEDLKLDMRRKRGMKITKNDIARAGIHLLAQDYKKNREKSYLARVSHTKPKS